MSALAHIGGSTSGSAPAAPPTPTKRGKVAYLLLLPGVLWLIVFFVVPLVQLFTVSLQSKFPGYPRCV